MDLNNVQTLQPVPLGARASIYVTDTTQPPRGKVTTTVGESFFITESATPSTSSSSSTSPTSSSDVKSTSGLPDLNISNGTCYYSPGKVDSSYIPCGNAAAAIQTCCLPRDACLVDRACLGSFNGTLITYFGGCTDPQWDLSDPAVQAACPDKPASYDSQPWVPLQHCGTENTVDDWIACPPLALSALTTTTFDCTCPISTAQRTVVFRDVATLKQYAVVPRSSGGTVNYAPDYTPTYAATTTAMATMTTTTGGPAMSSSTAGDISPPSSHKNTGLIAGVTVGVVGTVVLALVGAYFFFRKRKRAQAAAFGATGGANDNGNGPGNVLSPDTADEKMVGTSPSQGIVTISELDNRPARPWSLRSELDGTSTPPPGAVAANSNVAARDGIGTLLTSPPTSPTPGSVLYESSTVSSLHGQLTGQTTGGQTNASGGTGNGMRAQHPGASDFETLVELE